MGRWPPFLSHAASLPAVVVLPEPCKPAIRITEGRLRGEFEAGRVFAQQRDQLVADDLDDLLGGRERGEDFGADGFDANLLDQVADDVEVDVGFEQRDANFAQGFGDVLFGERALAAKGLEGALEFVSKVFKHSQFQVYRVATCGAANGSLSARLSAYGAANCCYRRSSAYAVSNLPLDTARLTARYPLA